MEQNNEQIEPTGDMRELCELLKLAAELKEDLSDKKAALGILQKAYDEVCDKVLRTMELLEMRSITAHGFTFYTHTESSVTTPKTPEEKKHYSIGYKEKEYFTSLRQLIVNH